LTLQEKLGCSIIVAGAQVNNRRFFVFALLACVSLIGGMPLIYWLFFSGVSEPTYNGNPLSTCLDGTLWKKRGSLEMHQTLSSIGPEALPWLTQQAGKGSFQNSIHLKYVKLYKSSSAVRRFLPKPGPDRWSTLQDNTFIQLSRLAPGTAYEGRALSAILASTSWRKNRQSLGMEMGLLSSFTNFPSSVLPVLVIGLTNPITVDTAVRGFQRFGTSATPVLYPIALRETGHIRPAELSLKKADPIAYERLIQEKARLGN
jgi:hypothetical protein